MLKNYVLCCNERITTGIELKIIERGKEKILRLVKTGCKLVWGRLFI